MTRPGESVRGAADRARTTASRLWQVTYRVLVSGPTVATLVVAVLLLAVSDCGTMMAGSSTIPGGPLDELAHAVTTLLVLWAMGRPACERFLIPALLASVVIDVDHIPARLGADWLTAGTPRPYTHSLAALVLVLACALVARRRRDVLIGVAIGLALHFWRDLAEPGSGVALLFPFSRDSFSLSHAGYVAVMVAIIVVDAIKCPNARRTASGSAGGQSANKAGEADLV